jgi:uncharacterized protein YegL
MNGDNVFGDSRQSIMPFYLICDVSASMWQEMTALHNGVMELRDAIAQQPVLNDVARISVLTFSDNARVVIQLTRMSELRNGMLKLVYENKTHYGAAFRVLARAITNDYAELKRKGHRVYPPCVYFLTDGEPTDLNWQQALREMLADKRMARMQSYPVIVPFGFRDATTDTLLRLAYPEGVARWYRASSSQIGSALEELLGIIKLSVLESGRSALSGAPLHVLPLPGSGSGVTSGIAGDMPEA